MFYFAGQFLLVISLKKNMILDIFFRVIYFLEKHIKPLAIVVIIFALFLFWYLPVLFSTMLIITVLIFLIGTFNPKQIKKSLSRVCVFLFILGIVFSPVLILLMIEKYELSHPWLLVDSQHPKMLEMTKEFQLNYTYPANNTKIVLDVVEDYVYEKIPYEYYRLPFFLPTTQEIASNMESVCVGRAFVGYSILKNMGYDVYMVTSFAGGTHAWVRVYEPDGSYNEDFTSSSISKPWVIFNESEVYWTSSMDQLNTVFFYGFKIPDTITFLLTCLFFLAPIGAGAIFILLSNRNRNFITYLSSIIIAAIVALASGSIGITNYILMPLPIIMAGGIYLRIISWIFSKNNTNLIEIR